MDDKNEGKMTALYEDFTGESMDFPSIVRECKGLVLSELLASEVSRLTSLFVEVCERHRRHRDYTRRDLRGALSETAAFFPVYRTYLSSSGGKASPEDAGAIGRAITAARSARPDLDPELFSFLEAVLLMKIPGFYEEELALRFQQLTGPAMAKGLEDTASTGTTAFPA